MTLARTTAGRLPLRRWIKGAAVAFAIGVVGVAFMATTPGDDFERRFGLSWLFEVRGPIDAPDDVVVVAIDARTGSHLDLPSLPREWPRSIHARLIRNLERLGASVVVLDMDFQRSRSSAEDAELGAAIERSGRVVLFESLDGKRLPLGQLGNRASNVDEQTYGSVWVEQLIPPVPVLAEAANALGPFPLPKLNEAVYQYWAFKATTDDAATMPAAALQLHALDHYEVFAGLIREANIAELKDLPPDARSLTRARPVSAAMRTLRRALKDNPQAVARLTEALHATRDEPLSPRQRQLITALVNLYAGPDTRYLNFYGPPGSVRTLPYHKVIAADEAGDESLPDLAGKIVFVGYSDLYDPGQPDRFYTVFTNEDGVDLSGVEIAATALANLLDDRELRPPDAPTSIAIVLAFGSLVGALVYLLPALVSVPLALVLGVSYGAGVQYLFNVADSWLPLATPLLLQLPLALFLGLLAQYLFERRQERQLTQAISYYLPGSIVADLTRAGGVDPVGLNRSVHATCLATDMAGFSGIAETLSPEHLAAFMNEYFEALSAPLIEHGVDVTEFRADAIMCAWTGLQSDEQLRRDAILAALGTVDAINRFSAETGRGNLSPRIGLETGEVFVGHAGGGGHFVYSIVGACANTASRIEGLNKQLGTQLLASEAVVEGFDWLLCRPLGSFLPIGNQAPVAVVEILALETAASDAQRRLCRRFARSLTLLRNGRRRLAAALLDRILDEFPDDGPARFYRERCSAQWEERLRRDDFVIRLETK